MSNCGFRHFATFPARMGIRRDYPRKALTAVALVLGPIFGADRQSEPDPDPAARWTQASRCIGC